MLQICRHYRHVTWEDIEFPSGTHRLWYCGNLESPLAWKVIEEDDDCLKFSPAGARESSN